ncbi:cell wall hydrolase [Candidatus Wolfebacteria bacterium]|nr:cell wall hydrolase [Candidatus Wolfebacteria bacterium]
MKSVTRQSDDVPISKAVAAVFGLLGVLGLMFSAHTFWGVPLIARAYAPEADTGELEEILWLARAVYSETKVRKEQELVAWVIRNRVASSKYPNTYQEVVLQPKQFSGLNSSDRHYSLNTTLDFDDAAVGWESAIAVANDVYFADDSVRPIASGVTHFYSPIAVRRTPLWAQGETPSHTVPDPISGSLRFAFYSNIK